MIFFELKKFIFDFFYNLTTVIPIRFQKLIGLSTSQLHQTPNYHYHVYLIGVLTFAVVKGSGYTWVCILYL
jgi:hypothetical protein